MPFKEIDYDIDIWHALASKPYTIFLDGNQRFSYILINPSKIWNTWEKLSTKIIIEKIPGLPPFQGGIAGFVSYDLAHCFNPTNNIINHKPKLIFGLYHQIFAFDHEQKKAWKIWQEHEPEIPSEIPKSPIALKTLEYEFSKTEYIKQIALIKERIINGDAYQVNISNKYWTSGTFKSNDLYHKLRNICSAPFSCFANFGSFAILSASPERFLKIENQKIITSPIKGTIAKLEDPVLDALNKEQLQTSEKDRAENIMIVDLMRSDFSKFCKPESIIIDELCQVYSFDNVHHLISTISGEILPNTSILDVFKNCMAAGSISGAPKTMAMNIISEIEKEPREAYCGHIFWSDGSNLDSNILIRTITTKGNNLSFRVGGGITHRSDPESEYQETLAKAKNLFNLCWQ